MTTRISIAKVFFAGLIAFALAAPSVQAAGAIISATSAVIDKSGPGFGSITDTLNQAGLVTGYVSGVTDFDTYIATAPQHTEVFAGFEWFSELGTHTAEVTYNLGSVQTIDKLALWNEESSGIGTLDLQGSVDGITFTDLAKGLKPTDNPLTLGTGKGTYGPDVFGFAATSLQYVKFLISDSPQPDPAAFDSAAIGEVAFRLADVPEPASITLLGIGVAGMAGYRLRRRKSATA